MHRQSRTRVFHRSKMSRRLEGCVFCEQRIKQRSLEGKKRSREATEEKEALILALEKQLVTLVKQQEANNAVR